MAMTVYTLPEVLQQVLAYYRGQFPARDLGPESWLGKQAYAVAMGLWLLQKAVEDADNDATPSTKTSTQRLDEFAEMFGLSSNSGGYGRNGAVAATGGAGPVTGINGTVFPNGSVLFASDGVTQFELSGAVTIPGVPPGSGSIAGSFIAITEGTDGNLPLNSVLAWASPPAGADATVTLSTSGLSGGLDVETDAALLARIFDRLRRPPKGGASVDYRTWAEEVSGVDRAYVYPLRAGLGTVRTVITAGGTGTGRQPAAAVQTAVDTAVALVRPAALQSYATLLPEMPAPNGLTIRARLRPSATRFNFEWTDTAATYKVDTYTAGSPATLKLDQVAPATLKSAIDAYTAGSATAPRIQVDTTTSPPVVPVQVRCTAWSDGGGKTTLTLENPLPTGWVAPSVNDVVYAGGPIATLIADELLAYVDSLGPSRADGYADSTDVWDDTCAIARLIDVALDVLDTDGVTALASNLAVSGGMTINAATNDVQGAGDISGSPEMLYAERVIVTQ